MSKLLFESASWDFDTLKRIGDACDEIAVNELRLDMFPNQIEIISSEQMLEAYTSIGMPVMYSHWSFGKHYLREAETYRRGKSGLAYELVINSDPCINYFMEENTSLMQTLVYAHASCGHNHFFKNNYLFKEWTSPDGIVDFLVFARDYVQECSDLYGPETVEQVLNAAHALMSYGVDRYRRPQKLNATKEKERMRERLKRQQADENVLWGTLPTGHRTGASPITEKFARIPAEPQENIMYFLEKQAPNLAQWERELIRIVRKLAQYFFPQGQTKVMNEGFASSVHYYIIHRLWEKGMLSDGNMLEFYASHSAVLYQPEYTSPRYSGYNPYALGFDIFQDIKIKAIARGDDWVDAWKDAVENYRDESAIRQFLSPEIIRKWRMMEIDNYETRDFMEVTAIQDDDHYNRIRETLADEHTIDAKKPMIEVINSNAYGDRTLELLYTPYRGSSLHKKQAEDTLHYIEKLWQYPVELHDMSKYDAISGANTGNLNLEYKTLYIPFSTLVPGFKYSALD